MSRRLFSRWSLPTVLVFNLFTLGPLDAQVTFQVNSTDDANDGTCDVSHCSLREAINAANANFGADVIAFSIVGTGPHTIQPGSALPNITDPVVIDGTTEPDFAGTPIVELDGTNAGSAQGLFIAAASSTVRGLVINRFGENGVLITGASSTGNVVEGNFIGTDVAGTAALGNGNHGVSIVSGSGNTVGGTTNAARNVISANSFHGVEMSADATGNAVQGNYIGTDVTGTADLGNGDNGVFVVGSPGNTIGGTAAGSRNVISGNGLNGIDISDAASSNNVIEGNYIGTDVSGTSPLANDQHGVSIADAPNTTIGGTTGGAGNVISGNGVHGVEIIFANANNTVLQGNYIGTNASGTAALGNGSNGITIAEVPNIVVGGTTVAARNIISGNTNWGVQLMPGGAGAGQTTGNVIQGNFIGVDVSGSAALGNNRGVQFSDVAGNTLGGTAPGAGNVISGNASTAVMVGRWGGANAENNLVQGNLIGTDPTGTVALGNGSGSGVMIAEGGHDNTIGGTAAGARNLVSGNANGITVASNNNIVQGNYIGTDLNGTVDLGNTVRGIWVTRGAADNLVGGTSVAAANIVSGNDGSGITIEILVGLIPSGNRIEGNKVGVDVNGSALGNAEHGIYIEDAFDNVIGGTSAGQSNTIAHNGGDGVSVVSGTGNQILSNAIYSNTGLGIDLGGDGVTANDPGDGDTGPNDLQNFPVLDFAFPGSTVLEGSLNSSPGSTFALEFFSSTTCDGTGHGQAESLVASTNVTTDGNGDATFSVSASSTLPLGTFVSGTATDAGGNTSEFSACVTVSDFAVSATPSAVSVHRGVDASYTVSVTPGATFNAPVSLSCSDLPAMASCSFSPAMVTPGSGSAMSDLTVSTANPGTPAGTATFTIEGVSGSAQNATTATLELQDFTVTASPSSETVIRGDDATYTVTVGPDGQTFDDPVDLGCDNLPAQTTCTFSPASLTPGATDATSSLTVSTTAPGTPTGQSSFDVVGTIGALDHSVTLDLDITKNFGIAVSPEAASVTRGQSATYTVTLGQEGFFDDAIDLSCSGLPSGASCAFSPASVTPNGSDATSTLTVSTSALAAMMAPIGQSVTLGIACLVMVLALSGLRGTSTRRSSLVLVLCMVVAALQTACGDEQTTGPPNPVTTTFTVTGTSGATQHSATATLTVG